MLEEYRASMRGKAVTVIGLGRSNLPLIRWLAAAGAVVTARDQKSREALGETGDMLDALGVAAVLGEAYLADIRADYIFCTPGMRSDKPEIAAAVAWGAVLTSEMAVFFDLCPCPIIGITGSDGKTTTTTIVSEMMKAAGYKVWLGGNIGVPLLDKVEQMSPRDWAVVELSSFQLMYLKRSPHISIVTNITPNHLDMHNGMDEYVDAKRNLVRYQKPGDIAVLNRDYALTAGFAADTAAQVRLFSRQGAGTVTLENGEICYESKPLLAADAIRIPGIHNVENYMAACAALAHLVPPQAMEQVARAFGGVEHRLELVREVNGVRYYNDSIGTSPTSTIAGLRSFDSPVLLIAGGYDKKIPFDALGREIAARCKALLLIGATAPKIRRAVEEAGLPEHLILEDCGNLETAVQRAGQRALAGDVVLLSPACASYDQFPNFEVRGLAFKAMVNQLKDQDQN